MIKTISVYYIFKRYLVDVDKDYMYLFTDNSKRTSGKNKIKINSWYFKKYNKGDFLYYPTMTQALIRGLDNAYPITTMVDSKRTQWTDDLFEQYKIIIDDEINQIKKNLYKYKGIKYSGYKPFGVGNYSNMKKYSPLLWDYLNNKLLEINIFNK